MEKTCGISLTGKEGGEPAGRFDRRRLPAPEHRGAAAARGGGDGDGTGVRLDVVCRGGRDGLLPGWKIKRDAKLGKGGKSVWSNSDITLKIIIIIITTTAPPAGRRWGGSSAGRRAAGGGSGMQLCKGWGSRALLRGEPPHPVPPSQPFPSVYYRGGLGAATGARKSAAGGRGAGPRPHAIPGASGAAGRGEPRNSRAARPARAAAPPQPPSGSPPKKPTQKRRGGEGFFFFG